MRLEGINELVEGPWAFSWPLRAQSDLIAFYARPAGTEALQPLTEPIVRTSGSTTVALVNAVASSSQTVVEFIVEDESFPQDMEGMQQIVMGAGPLPGEGLHLSGFAEKAVLNRRTIRDSGQFHLVWELPPPATVNETLLIEIEALRLNRLDPQTGRMTFGSLPGPWRFEFLPRLMVEVSRTPQFAVNETKMSGPVAVTLEEVQLSATETLISVHYDVPPDVGWQSFGTPTLRYHEESYDGREKRPPEGDRTRETWSFPALPAGATIFVVEFNPLWLTVADEVDVTLDLDRLRAGEQVVVVGDYALAFTLAPSAESMGFMLAYRPADAASATFILAAPGEERMIIEDDLGNRYTLAGGNMDFEPQEGFALQRHAFYTHEPLLEAATKLTLSLSHTGRITEAVQFEVAVPSSTSR